MMTQHDTRKFSLFLMGLLALLLGLAACASVDVQPTLPELEPGVWTAFTPGGDTVCADGSPYTYYVRPGTVNKVVVDFQGGGACWNDGTCAGPQDQRSYVASVNVDGTFDEGIYDHTDAANPFKDWYHVFVPYCTADIHWGDNVATYTTPEGNTLAVNHKGAVNARAVLSWVFDNFSAPEDAFVTGCSAGAYGSIMWTPQIKQHYPRTNVYQMGDSGAGVVTADFVGKVRTQWNAEGAFPAFIPGLDPATNDVLQTDFLTSIYARVGEFYPGSVLSQYNTLYDGTQTYFYGLMADVVPPTPELSAAWSNKMLGSLELIRAKNSANNFYAYVSTLDNNTDPNDGTAHCVIPRPQFYTESVNGVPLTTWLSDMVSGKPITSVAPEIPASGGAASSMR